jgi:exonuclease SbcD
MKLLHTADIHLGAKNYGRTDRATGLSTRLLDTRRSLDAMVARAVEEDVDAFLFCGDAYHTPDPTPTQQKLFAEGLRPLADAGIPLVLVVGNHDHPVTYGRASSLDIFQHLAGTVYYFAQPESAVIHTKSGPLQLLALPWPVRSRILARDEYRTLKPDAVRQTIEDIYTRFVQQAASELDATRPTVLAGHFAVQGAALAGSERTSLLAQEPKFSVGQLAVPPIDYVALGHIHQHQDRNPDGSIPVVYAGSIERVSFKEADERKGFVLVEIDPARPHPSHDAGGHRRARTTFVETPARRFVSIRVDAREAAEPTAVVLEAIAQEAIDDAIVRVGYRIDEAQVAHLDTERIRAALTEADVVAAIERTIDPAERERRTVVTRESGLEDALRQYLAQHDDLGSVADDLVEAALALDAELSSEER